MHCARKQTNKVHRLQICIVKMCAFKCTSGATRARHNNEQISNFLFHISPLFTFYTNVWMWMCVRIRLFRFIFFYFRLPPLFELYFVIFFFLEFYTCLRIHKQLLFIK